MQEGEEIRLQPLSNHLEESLYTKISQWEERIEDLTTGRCINYIFTCVNFGACGSPQDFSF